MPDYACDTYYTLKKKSHVSKTSDVNDNLKLAHYTYLNEVFDYLGFLGYQSRCRQLMVGRR